MSGKLKLILPKGRIQEKVMRLLKGIGVAFSANGRCLRPFCDDDEIEAKILKPQNIPTLIALGRHDCGFTGHDWIVEQDVDVVENLDLGFDPVRIVAAVPERLADIGTWRSQKVVLASEYRNIAKRYIADRNLEAVFVQSFGATEALPPEDADMIIDNTATGSTLEANRLVEVDEIMRSTTRFICNRNALEDPVKRKKIDQLIMLMKSSLNARARVLLEMNVSSKNLNAVVDGLPCMRAPTVTPLHAEEGYAVKTAVFSSEVLQLIPRLVAAGARDILEYRMEKIITQDEASCRENDACLKETPCREEAS